MNSLWPGEKMKNPVEKQGLTCGKAVETLWNRWGKLFQKIRIAKPL